MSQIRLLPGVDPDELVERVKAEHRPVATVCLFSGGNDSTVLAHRCREHYESLVFIDTGTAVPGVRDFVESFALWLGKPLRIYEAGDEFRRMVLGTHDDPRTPCPRCGGKGTTTLLDTDLPDLGEGPERPCPRCGGLGRVVIPLGFPGPAQHGRAYNRLKERSLERLRRDLKEGEQRNARVLYLTGLRRGESQRRSGRPEVSRKGSSVFANPLIDWTNDEMRAYRTEQKIPQSDVAALIHRSGECNCGAFAGAGEREMMQALWPDWFERTIASLEREAEAAGIRFCRWGQRNDLPAEGDAGELCSDWCLSAP